jgi:hypothetical protein
MFGKNSKEDLKIVLLDILGKPTEDIATLLKEAKERIDPTEEVSKLKRELKELELKKTMEERETEHLVKLKQEKLSIEFERKEIELQKKYQAKEMTLQTEYHNKIIAEIQKGREEQQKTYAEIMKRLPNVNMRITDKTEKTG